MKNLILLLIICPTLTLICPYLAFADTTTQCVGDNNYTSCQTTEQPDINQNQETMSCTTDMTTGNITCQNTIGY